MGERPYKVFTVIYRCKHSGLTAVAVSSQSKRGAKSRLIGHRGDEIIEFLSVEEIPDREPEYAQDRIEGTVDLENPQALPPQAGTTAACLVRASNSALLGPRFPKSV